MPCTQWVKIKWFVRTVGKHHIVDVENIPEWIRTIGITEDDKIVYMPAAIAGPDENEVAEKALDAGRGSIEMEDHIYLPAEWVGEAYPELLELSVNIIRFALTADRETGDVPCSGEIPS